MFAGHGKFALIQSAIPSTYCSIETTAHSIDTTLSYLALYPEHQDKVYAEISKLLHDRGNWVRSCKAVIKRYSDLQKFSKRAMPRFLNLNTHTRAFWKLNDCFVSHARLKGKLLMLK